MRALAIALLASIAATPALAQFPPPGVYACTTADGAPFGELNLFVAGDYSLKGTDGNSASGQLASAANSVNPLSGPLRDAGLTGAFETDQQGQTRFRFTNPDGLVVECA
jgi:hypothetical protein